MPSLIESSVLKPRELKSRKLTVRGANSIQETQIADCFSAAANSYQDHNKLQRLSAESLLAGFLPKGKVLDIGAGPGTDFSVQHTGIRPMTVFALDIALGMLQKLKQTYPHYHSVCADAEQLPFGVESIDSIYSNLALQWCGDFPAAVAEMARVLVPNGECHLSIVASGSLTQLSELGLRVNDFSPLAALQGAFTRSQWQLVEMQILPMTVHFETLRALLYSIKGVGASVQSACSMSKTTGELRGRQDWLALQTKAEAFREPQGLPLTYQIAQIRARRRV